MSKHKAILVNDEVEAALALGEKCAVAIGVSGGKDSTAVGLATMRYLKERDFKGPVILIHACLGMVEWADSEPACHRLAEHLGMELAIVRRKAGGMMERWEGRWAANLKRYSEMKCVKLILPWSTATMRFCTSELKVAPICSELRRRFRGHRILNVVGIRRQESTARAQSPVTKEMSALKLKTVVPETGLATSGMAWNPILDWTEEDVWEAIDASGIPRHDAYTDHGMTRVSCRFCILSSRADIKSAAAASESADLYRRMVQLELDSTFAFQSGYWLADTRPDLLTTEDRARVDQVKAAADMRVAAESRIPPHLLYTKGWPTAVPTESEAGLIAAIRRDVGLTIGQDLGYQTAEAVQDRYVELAAERSAKEAIPA